jgi:hypothetical protein
LEFVHLRFKKDIRTASCLYDPKEETVIWTNYMYLYWISIDSTSPTLLPTSSGVAMVLKIYEAAVYEHLWAESGT